MHDIEWLFLVFLLVQTSMACPPSCICKWKGGKQTVECINKSMTDIPGDIDSGMQVLEFAGNNLKLLESERFQRAGLVNLQKIFMSRCRIGQVDDKAFKGLSNLVELDLSHNIITSVPSSTFHDYPSLMKIFLNGNPLRVIKTSAFYTLPYLVSLELSRCQLETIESNAFAGLNNLEWLKLDHNLLKYIPSTLPNGLHGVALQHNPWICDCFMVDLYFWLNSTTIPEALEPMCDGPSRLKGAPIKLLDPNELACVPDVTPTSLYLEIGEGKNVSFLCKVHSIPEAKVSWWFQDHVLHNDSIIAPGVHLYYFVEEGTIDKKSELFIFNTNIEDNGTFVCVAENQAGRSQSNYTIRIMLKEEPLVEARRMQMETVLIISGAIVGLMSLIIICLVIFLVRYRVSRKRRQKKEKSKELALYGNQSRRNSNSTITGETEFGASCSNVRDRMKMNGGIHGVEMNSANKIMRASEHSHQSTPAYLTTYPAYSLVPSCSAALEQNPDLITDTEKERHAASMQKKSDEIQQEELSSTGQCNERFDATGVNGGLLLMKNVHDSMTDSPASALAVNGAISQCHEDAGRGWISGSADTNQPSTGSCTGPLIVCFNHFQPTDIHLTPPPEKFMTLDGGSSYPLDYGLPKLASHFPPLMPATAFYRTLPHRRQNMPQNTAVASLRYAREAEFLTRSAQPAPYEHFRTGDVRYNVEGYPKTTPHVTFSDTVHIIEKSTDNQAETNANKSTQVENSNFKPYTPQMISLINASAQTTNEELIPNTNISKTADRRVPTVPPTPIIKPSFQKPKPLAGMKNSPDEGYVGDCTDIGDV